MSLDQNMDISPFWRLAEKLSVVQAALLMIGIEPQELASSVENWVDTRKPTNYIAARESIIRGIQSNSLEGNIKFRTVEDFNGNVISENQLDFEASEVQVTSLIEWLDKNGFVTVAFKKADKKPKSYLDTQHPRYSPKLAAVVEAWESFDPESNDVGTPKQRLMKWLRLNASRFGITREDGSPSENVIEELAKVANWSTAGGAPKSKIEEPDPF